MTTIVTKSNSKAYAIYVDGRKIVECAEPETSANELVKNLGIPIKEVQVIEMATFPTTIGTGLLVGSIAREILQEVITEKTGIDDIINKVNSATLAPNAGKYKKHIVSSDNEDAPWPSSSNDSEDNEQSVDNTVPVGNVEIPKLGNLVYVNGFDGFLRKITGGIGTVHMVFDEETKAEVKPDDEPESVLVELEEVPGVYFSWNELKDEQAELKNKYGYKPVCSIK